MHQVPAESLHTFIETVFIASGLPIEEAKIAADVLSYADQHAIDTHGISNLDSIYIHKIRSGAIDINATGEWERQRGAVARYNAKKKLGLVAAKEAMDKAIVLAQDFGIGCVVVKNSTHFGAAGYYTKMALEKNMIGMAMTNLGSQAIAKPLNCSKNLLGTNPISMAACAGDEQNFVLDMSTTSTSSGKVKLAARRGNDVPPGWLLNSQGQAVTDPNAYLDNTAHLSMLGGSREQGGYKGMGLGMMVDILCGTLSGAEVGPNQQPDKERDTTADNNIGHFLLTINTSWLRDIDEFKKSMDSMLQAVL
jgi:LDH2 family malate/lactate/ureidoglycolate dehydrogenase